MSSPSASASPSPSQPSAEKNSVLKLLHKIFDYLKPALWVVCFIIFVVAFISLVLLLNAKDESLKIYAIIPGVILFIYVVIFLIKLKSIIIQNTKQQ